MLRKVISCLEYWWYIDFNLTKVYRKIQLNNSYITFIDFNKDINIYNFDPQKIGTNNTINLNKINELTLLKKRDKFILYSSDSIIKMWEKFEQHIRLHRISNYS